MRGIHAKINRDPSVLLYPSPDLGNKYHIKYTYSHTFPNISSFTCKFGFWMR